MSVNAIPVGMEIFPSSDEDAWSIITSYIDLSDYYVVIIGGCYGSVNPETGISYTEMEYDYAVSKSIPVMPFLHENVGELRRNMTEEDPVKALKLKAFQEKAKLRHCNFYSDEKDLALKVITSYSQMTARRPGIGWIRGDQAKTKEEAERMAYLERRVGELEKQLSSSQEYIELYEECEIPYELQILVRYNGKPEPTNPKKISMPFNEILAAIKDEMLTGISESAISKNVSEFANNKYLKITLTEKDHVYLQNDTLELNKVLIIKGIDRI
jgi:hypothetical protein